MIRPLTIGNHTFPTNIIQGPLAGVSCAPFRRLTWQYGKPAFSCTEMISCKSIIYQPAQALERLVKIDPAEGPVCFQLSSTDEHELAEAVRRVTSLGANLIDLNCGCPVKKIRTRGAGSRLLAEPKKLYQLIRAMKDNTHLPVSIKIRVDGNSDERFNHEIASMLQDAMPDFVIVHGRHWAEHYETPCNHNEIEYFVKQLTIPVIGNGDIRCIESLKQMYATGCAGVMIGRAGVGQPWLIQQLTMEMNDEKFIPMPLELIGKIFLEHTNELIQLLNSEKFAILQIRKLAKYYARTLPNRNDFCDAVNVCEDLTTLQKIVFDFFK